MTDINGQVWESQEEPLIRENQSEEVKVESIDGLSGLEELQALNVIND